MFYIISLISFRRVLFNVANFLTRTAYELESLKCHLNAARTQQKHIRNRWPIFVAANFNSIFNYFHLNGQNSTNFERKFRLISIFFTLKDIFSFFSLVFFPSRQKCLTGPFFNVQPLDVSRILFCHINKR